MTIGNHEQKILLLLKTNQFTPTSRGVLILGGPISPLELESNTHPSF